VQELRSLASNGALTTAIVSMAVSVVVCEISSGDLENRVRVRSKSLKMAPFDRSYTTSYSPSTQPFILNWWINRVPADSAGVRAGDAVSVGWQVTLCDPI